MELNPIALKAALEATKEYTEFARNPDAECCLEMGEVQYLVEDIIKAYLNALAD